MLAAVGKWCGTTALLQKTAKAPKEQVVAGIRAARVDSPKAKSWLVKQGVVFDQDYHARITAA